MARLIWHAVKPLTVCGAIAALSLHVGHTTDGTTAALIALALCVAAALVVVLNWRRGAPNVSVVLLTMAVTVWFCFLVFLLVSLVWLEWLMGRGWFVALFVLVFVIAPIFCWGIDQARNFVRGEGT